MNCKQPSSSWNLGGQARNQDTRRHQISVCFKVWFPLDSTNKATSRFEIRVWGGISKAKLPMILDNNNKQPGHEHSPTNFELHPKLPSPCSLAPSPGNHRIW